MVLGFRSQGTIFFKKKFVDSNTFKINASYTQKEPPEVFSKKVVKSFGNFKGKHLCGSLFLIKLQAFRFATLLKRGSNAVVFL